MNRRNFLMLLSTGVLGHTLDLDRLLWIPRAKTIFLPPIKRLTTAEIIAIEMERIVPSFKKIFDDDSILYQNLSNRDITTISSRAMRVPLLLGKEIELD